MQSGNVILLMLKAKAISTLKNALKVKSLWYLKRPKNLLGCLKPLLM